ncbi:MAG: hypothetical protein RJQ04_08430 [Longimicrobiales bacterium]
MIPPGRSVGWVEHPVGFGDDGSLVGTVCVPAHPSSADPPAVVFLNAGIIHRTGPNRVYVHMARTLAEMSVPSLRFDLSGIGDSAARGGEGALSLRDQVAGDTDQALAFLRERWGLSRFVLLGLCSGADHALWLTGQRADVAGVVLLDLNMDRPPGYTFHHYRRRILKPSSWWNVLTGRHPALRNALRRGGAGGDRPRFSTTLQRSQAAAALHAAAERRAPVLAVFTGDVEYQYNHRGQMRRLFRDVPLEGTLTELYRPSADHTFSLPTEQEWLLARVAEWAGGVAFPDLVGRDGG